MTVDALLETALRRDRWVVLAMLAAVIVLAWAHLLIGVGQGGMDVMAPAAWSLGYAATMLAMWCVMMVAMMLPSAAPMVLLFAAVNRKQRPQGDPYMATALFMLGYIALWSAFSAAATGLQWAFSTTGLIGPDMVLASAALAGGILLGAGLYQLTPVKQACLRHCRSPVHFISSHWRTGSMGAFRMGLAHGVYCVGCCWFLMLLLFFGGVMNLFWIGGLAVFVLFEKMVPASHWLSYVVGLTLTVWGSWLMAAAI